MWPVVRDCEQDREAVVVLWEVADADDPALSDLYRRAMRLELDFFDASSPSATG